MTATRRLCPGERPDWFDLSKYEMVRTFGAADWAYQLTARYWLSKDIEMLSRSPELQKIVYDDIAPDELDLPIQNISGIATRVAEVVSEEGQRHSVNAVWFRETLDTAVQAVTLHGVIPKTHSLLQRGDVESDSVATYSVWPLDSEKTAFTPVGSDGPFVRIEVDLGASNEQLRNDFDTLSQDVQAVTRHSLP